jgi:hypothetical protein
MKTRTNSFFNSLIVLVVAFNIQSCTKKTTTPTPVPTNNLPPSYSFTAFGITANDVNYNVSSSTLSSPLVITGTYGNTTDANYQTVQITIPTGVSAPTTFTLNAATSSGGDVGIYTDGPYPNTANYNTNAGHTGILNITKVDLTNRLMSASFNFVAQQYASANTGTVSVSGSFANIGF